MISYAITSHNETYELKRLLEFLMLWKDQEVDEVVILDDFSYDSHIEMLQPYIECGFVNTFEQRKLKKDFASQKNYLNSLCTKDYIFQLDADEVPQEGLIMNLKAIINANPNVELFWVPRINTVEGITEEHCRMYGYKIDEKGWINFPDPQARLYKNSKKIQWVKPVHEILTGAKVTTALPFEEDFCLIHTKNIEKQVQQNKFYNEEISGYGK
jgi:glycosyltransferase involved in cell wall biosynthesis|tara:strand:+ start:1621 stop:2259 length:639 start_codon:yes stop_codon:yes gene_type:complete